MTRAKLTVEIDVEVVLDGAVKKFSSSAYIGVPKDYIGKRAKVLILKDGV